MSDAARPAPDAGDPAAANAQALALGVHILGQADLGAPRDEGVGAVTAFARADRRERLAMLTQVRADAPSRHPAVTTLLRDPRYALSRLLVVATDQTSTLGQPDARDTIEIGRFLASLDVDEQHALWGRRLNVELVVVDAPTLQQTRTRLRPALRGLADDGHAPRRVLLGPTGGVSAAMGALLAAYEAGLRPRVCTFPDRDRVESHDLLVQHDELVWLSRLGAFEALADAADDPQRPRPAAPTAGVWRVLARLAALDWEGLAAALPAAGPATRQTIGVPAELGDATPPDTAAGWEWMRLALQASLALRAANRDPEALRLVPAWAEAIAGELILRSGVAPEADQPDTGPGRWARPYLDGDDATLESALASRHSDSILRLRRVLAAVGRCWSQASGAAAGRPLPPTRLDASARSAIAEALTLAGGQPQVELAVRQLGYPSWSPLPRHASVAVLPVGRQNVTDAGTSPMLEAVATTLARQRGALAGCGLVLAATPETAAAAATLAALADAAGFGRVVVADGLAIGDHIDAQRRLGAALAPVVGEADELVVVVGPGGKALATATVGASVQAAFDAMRPVRVATLVEQPDGTSHLDLGDDADARVAARLAHDDTLALVLPSLLARLELTTMRSVLALGSPLWEGVARAVDDLQRLCSATDADLASQPRLRQRLEARAPLDARGLWRARCHLFAELAATDPWRALAATVAAGHAAWGEAWGHEPDDAAGAQLRRWHDHSPLGGSPHGSPPASQALAETIRAAATSRQPTPAAGDPPDAALQVLHRHLGARLEEIEVAARAASAS